MNLNQAHSRKSVSLPVDSSTKGDRMALTWDVTKVKDYAINFPDGGTPENPEWNFITNAIVWLSLICGFRTIDEGNYVEVFARIKAYEDAFGAYCHNTEGPQPIPRPITLDDIKKHIGFTSNASVKTLRAFKAYLGEQLYRDALRNANNQVEALKEKPKLELVKT